MDNYNSGLDECYNLVRKFDRLAISIRGLSILPVIESNLHHVSMDIFLTKRWWSTLTGFDFGIYRLPEMAVLEI